MEGRSAGLLGRLKTNGALETLTMSNEQIDVFTHTTRPLPPSDGENFNVGHRLKTLRSSHGLTIAALGQRAGVARSTISKIENGQMSPTLDVIQKLCHGLNENIATFFTDTDHDQRPGRRSITLSGNGKRYNNRCYEHEVLCTDLSRKKMFAALSTIKARSINDFDEWVSHDGEEFFYVVSGSVSVYSELYEPLTLHPGDAMYFDCSMGHATISTSDEDAKVLWVFSP